MPDVIPAGAGIADGAAALPLLCRRLSARVSDEYSAGRLATAAASGAWFHLEAAAGAAAQLAAALSAAAAQLGGGRDGAR
jgi:hypothetical protein